MVAFEQILVCFGGEVCDMCVWKGRVSLESLRTIQFSNEYWDTAILALMVDDGRNGDAFIVCVLYETVIACLVLRCQPKSPDKLQFEDNFYSRSIYYSST